MMLCGPTVPCTGSFKGQFVSQDGLPILFPFRTGITLQHHLHPLPPPSAFHPASLFTKPSRPMEGSDNSWEAGLQAWGRGGGGSDKVINFYHFPPRPRKGSDKSCKGGLQAQGPVSRTLLLSLPSLVVAFLMKERRQEGK